MSRPRRPIALDPDVLVVVVFAVIVLVLGLLRREYIGDGVRHVAGAINGNRSLGETRWVLFPAALATWIGAASALRLVHSTGGALTAFVVLDVIAGVAYLLGLRSILRSLELPPRVRGECLALAASLAPLLVLSSDAAEPMVAAAFAVGGIAVAVASGDAPARWRSMSRLAVGIVLIGFGAFLYQGVILAFFFLPALLGMPFLLRKRALLVAFAAVALVGVAFVAIVAVGDGISAGQALGRLARISGNERYNDWIQSSFRWPRVVAALAGPPQGVFYLQDFTGIRSLIHGLGEAGMRPRAAGTLGELLVGGGICAALVLAAVRAGRARVLLALAGIAILPVLLRPSQYGYVKFWVLLPAFAAVAAADLSSVVRLAITAVVAISNVAAVATTITAGRGAYAERAAVYREASPRTCWVDAAWGPRVPQAWPGRTCSLLGTLAFGHARTMEELAEQNGQALATCLRWCFCEADGTWTDNFTRSSLDTVRAVADHFLLRRVDVTPLLSNERDSQYVERSGAVTAPVLAYTGAARRLRCALLAAP